MNNLVGVVNKPQFDVNVFEVGKAVHLKQFESNGYKLKSVDCIITETNPLYLIVYYYSESECEMTDLKIKIDNVVSGEFRVNLMKEEK